jgi:HEAT repeat protein
MSRNNNYIIIFAIFLLSFALTQAAVIKVAFPPAQWTVKRPDDDMRIQTVLSLHLRDAFENSTDIQIADEGWVSAVLGEVRGSKRKTQPETFFATFTSFIPVDDFIDFSSDDKRFTCTIYSSTGKRDITVPIKKNTTTKSLAIAIAPFISKELKVNGDTAARLIPLATISDEAFESAYLARRMRGDWVNSNGGAQFKILSPYVENMKGNPVLIRSLLEAGIQLTTDKRKTDNISLQLTKARAAMIQALGTINEPLAMEFLRINILEKAKIEDDLIAFVKQLDARETADDVGDQAPGNDNSLTGLLKPPGTIGQCIGAVRALGNLHSVKALPWIQRIAKHDDIAARVAAAYALGQYGESVTAKDALRTLVKDDDAGVAFEALAAIWNNGTSKDITPEIKAQLIIQAREILKMNPGNTTAMRVIIQLGNDKDIPLLQSFLNNSDITIKIGAMKSLAQLKAIDIITMKSLLNDSNPLIVMEALKHVELMNTDAKPTLVKFANNPYEPLAEIARQQAEQFIPATEKERTSFLLDIESTFIRRQIVGSLAKNTAPWVTDVLVEVATTNAKSHIRSYTMDILLKRTPEKAAPIIKAALSDPYYWVRFRACTFAPMVAKLIGADALRVASNDETDPSGKLYLADAIAIAEGKVTQTTQKNANKMDPQSTYAGMTGYASGVVESPFQFYYCLSAENIDDAAKKASENGKVFYYRVKTAPNPSQVLLEPAWEDLSWQTLRDGLKDWKWIDGVVIGEETMYAGRNNENTWRLGWRAFCMAAKIDPHTINGDRTKLSPAGQKAWEYWEQQVAIDGFNELYDFIHLYFGKLRPGFKVGTFMTDQDVLKPQEKEWKFDFAGAYYYETSNNERYAMIRRYNTVWPDRPLIWLSMGDGEYNGLRQLNYKLKLPEKPILRRNCLGYADSVCAWMAGAQNGFFEAYLFEPPTSKGGFDAHGKYVWMEDIGTPVLDAGIETVFSGVFDIYKKAASVIKPEDDDPENKPEKPEIDVAAIKTRVDNEKKSLRNSFIFEQQNLYNITRILSDLPRPDMKTPFLWVTPNRRVRQVDWCNSYDIQYQINNITAINISEYSVIGIIGMDTTSLRDSTIVTLTNWVKEKPRVLYIRGVLSTDITNKANTPDDMNNTLQNHWPWEKDVVSNGKSYKITGAARALVGTPDEATLVYWKGDGNQGGVIFDLSPNNDSRDKINALLIQEKIGIPFDGTPGMKIMKVNGITAVVATGSDAEPLTLKGVDFLTGEPNPVMTKGRSAAIVAEKFRGKYIFAEKGISILGTKPLENCGAIDDGVKVTCLDLMQIGSITGKVKVMTANSKKELNAISVEKINEWLLYSTDEGIAVVPVGGKGAVTTYVRCKEPVIIYSDK